MSEEYAPGGLLGLAVPQANPVAEAELRVLLPPAVGVLATRLVSAAADPGRRLREYADGGLAAAVASFDTAPVRAMGFACTAACYLLGPEREAARFAAAGREAGFAIVTATGAVAAALAVLGATRIALVTPYPSSLDDAAVEYWAARGVTVVSRHRVAVDGDDTRAIYALPGSAAAAGIASVERDDVDAVLVSGTGLPALAAIRAARSRVPVLSANLCLAWELLRRLGHRPAGGPESVLLGGWAPRLAAAQGGVP